MNTRSLFLTLTLGLVAGLFACNDQGVVAPEAAISPDDLVAAFGRPTCENPDLAWPKCQEDDGGGDDYPPTLQLGGVVGFPELLEPDPDVALVGFSQTDVTWKSKKGIFSMHAPFSPKINYTGWELGLGDDTDLGNCIADGPEGQALMDAFIELGSGGPEVGGRLTNIFFDQGAPNGSSVEHRIFVLVEGTVVRYYQFGSWYEDGELVDPATIYRTDDGDVSKFTLKGGVLAIRDIEGPSRVTRIKCPMPDGWSVTVELNKNPTQ